MSTARPADDVAAMLEARYGSARPSRPVIAVGVLLAAALAGLLGWIGWYAANPPVRWKLLAYQDTPTEVVITYEVRKAPEATVTCVLRAQDEAHIDVGYALVTLPGDGRSYVQQRYPLATLAPAFTAEVITCAVGAGTPPGAPAPQFGPGVVPPPQPPPGRAPAA